MQPNNVYQYIDPYYLFFLLNSEKFNSYLKEQITGVNINNLNQKILYNYQIPLPPLSEQKRIVAKLDKVFAAIDKAKANAEKNLANAKELFQSYLNGIFANPGKDWEEKKLGEVCEEVLSGGTPPTKKKEYWQGNIPWITSADIIDIKTASQEDISLKKLLKNLQLT